MKRQTGKIILLFAFIFSFCSCEKEKLGLEYLIDSEGNRYKTVTIGSQVWMAENLKASMDTLGNSVECYSYNNNDSKIEEYGYLYTWEAAKKVCPEGWHLPNKSDWNKLELSLGLSPVQADEFGWRGTDHGTKLKEGGSSGFDALLAGYKDGTVIFDGEYFDMGYFAAFWSTTEYDELNGVCIFLYVTRSSVLLNDYDKTSGLSVRCLKD